MQHTFASAARKRVQHGLCLALILLAFVSGFVTVFLLPDGAFATFVAAVVDCPLATTGLPDLPAASSCNKDAIDAVAPLFSPFIPAATVVGLLCISLALQGHHLRSTQP